MNSTSIRTIRAALATMVVMPALATAGPIDPADPLASVPQVTYRSVLRDYRPAAIVEKPSDWRDLNQRAEQIGGPGGQLRGPDEPIRRRRR